MKNIKTYNQFINEADTDIPYDEDDMEQKIARIKDRLHAPMDGHDDTFDLENLKDKIEKGNKDAEKDIETVKQLKKDNKYLKAGDFVIHKHKQSMGIGNIQKIHPSKTHADVHFVRGLKSSLADDKAQTEYDLHTMEIKHLMPVIGTQG